MSVVLGLVLSIALGAVVTGAANVAIVLFNRGDKIQALCAGVIIGVVNYFSPIAAKAAPWIAPLFFMVMLGVSVVLILWWHVEGSDFVEMIPILVLTVLTFFTTKAAASATCTLITSDFLKSVLMTIPALVLVGSIGFYIYDLMLFQAEFRGEERRYE